MRYVLIALCLLTALYGGAQDSSYIKVHFLYGSKPKKQYRGIEKKWFGGLLGGHAGIEADSNQVLSFVPSGKFHVIASRHNRHSSYIIHNPEGFYSILGGKAADAKKTIIYIPVTNAQKQQFDSISAAYLHQTPYDYALFGTRCGAATYEILARLGILKQYSYRKNYWKIFYPKKLRKRLLARASRSGWKVETTTGTDRRKWEKD